MKLTGLIASGFGCASKNLRDYQSWHFRREYDELKNIFHGSINITLENYLVDPDKLKIDFRTSPIPIDIHSTSHFEFIRILFQYGRKEHRAWIYQPFGYHWYDCGYRNKLEIIAEEIPKVKLGAKCQIQILNKGFGSTSVLPHVIKMQRSRQ